MLLAVDNEMTFSIKVVLLSTWSIFKREFRLKFDRRVLYCRNCWNFKSDCSGFFKERNSWEEGFYRESCDFTFRIGAHFQIENFNWVILDKKINKIRSRRAVWNFIDIWNNKMSPEPKNPKSHLFSLHYIKATNIVSWL